MYKSTARCKKVNVKNFVYDAQQVGSKEAHSGQHTERSEVFSRSFFHEVSYTKLYYTKRSEVSYTKFLTRSYIMKKILILLLALLPMAAVQAKSNKQTVVLYCDLHCQGCCDKIMKNIAFEKGVKDIQFDMEQKSVTVTFDANKTDVPTLQKAFAKIGKPATTRRPESAEHADHDHHGDTHQGTHEGHSHK